MRKQIFLLILLMTLMAGRQLHAGSVIDAGTVTLADGSTPTAINYTLWVDTGNGQPPTEILTEDAYNAALGADQGYKDGYWMFSATNFSVVPADRTQLRLVIAGIGDAAGNLWEMSFPYEVDATTSIHAELDTPTAATCPTMTAGSEAGTGAKSVEWTGEEGTYYVYRSQSPADPTSERSNGRYEYVATVNTTGTQGSYVDNVGSTESWHLVIQGDGSGNITGCHSEPPATVPTATGLTQFGTQSVATPLFVTVALALLIIVALGAYLALKRRR